MRVLGIDPGTALTGYGVIDAGGALVPLESGVIRTPARAEEGLRLAEIHRAVQRLIATHRPRVVAVERVYFNKNVQSALAVGQARGVVLLAAAQAGVPVAEFTPLEVKQAVSGQGGAAKGQVGYMVRVILGLPAVPRPDDAADALAVAICCAHTWRTRERWAGSAR